MIKRFYPQSDACAITFAVNYTGGYHSFGASGDNLINIEIQDDIVKIDDLFVDIINKGENKEYSIYGANGNVTVWANQEPIYHPLESEFHFESIFYPEEISPRVFVTQPEVVVSFSGVENQEGLIVIENNGAYDLEISNIILDNSYFTPNITSGSVPATGSWQVPMSVASYSQFSGIGFVSLMTSAGEYEFSGDLNYNFIPSYEQLDLRMESEFFGNSRVYNYFLTNAGTEELQCELFFNIMGLRGQSITTGTTHYTSGGSPTVHYGGTGGFFKRIPASGKKTEYISELVYGSKAISINYNGEITGVGGRLGGTGIRSINQTGIAVLYTEGEVVYSFNIPVSSYIGSSLATAFITGTRTGIVGPGSGKFLFQEQIESSVPYAFINGIAVYPDTGHMFTGNLNQTVILEKYVSGDQNFTIYNYVDVYEGQGDMFELWSFDYNSIDVGLFDYYNEGLIHSSGYGALECFHRIPTGTTTSGQIRFLSDYTSRLSFDMMLQVNSSTSISKNLYITT